MLFAGLAAGQPCKIQPVANLPFHIRPARLSFLHPKQAHIPAALRSPDLADFSAMNPPHNLYVMCLMPTLRARHDGQPFSLSLFGRFNH